MALITEAEFFTLLYKIKIYCALCDVKKIHNAIPTTFAFVVGAQSLIASRTVAETPTFSHIRTKCSRSM